MNILLVNPAHLSIGSRLAKEHLPPLGLLAVGGPLIDAGHHVQLLDADFHNDPVDVVVQKILTESPDAILLGHSGSTSAQPVIDEITAGVRQLRPAIVIVVGGVFPTYHWQEILAANPQIDYIVCGEGERTTLHLMQALANQMNPQTIPGIALRVAGKPTQTAPAELIEDLDAFRIGWELMQGTNYTYWGNQKAVVIQFSRGCPYPCTYCGQSRFWKTWRHRSARSLADEMEMLHHQYGIRVFNFADENPASNPQVWKAFLEALIAKNLNLVLVGSIRADNIVRDANFLHLYKQAGFERFLLGIENYNEVVLAQIKKSGAVATDKAAIQLLRKQRILSMATYVVGFGEETSRDFYHSLKQLLSYDPDQVQLLYVTPHRWTPYFDEVKAKEIILADQRLWDYKHQVLATAHLKPWVVIVYVKLIELILQTRPRALYRLLLHKDARIRHGMRWYSNIGRRVWLWELFQFIWVTKLLTRKMLLKDFWRQGSVGEPGL